jgi:hypothetical protein
MNLRENETAGTYSKLPIFEHSKQNYRKLAQKPSKRSRETSPNARLSKTKNSELMDSKKYLVVLKNGARIPMNRNEYIAY